LGVKKEKGQKRGRRAAAAQNMVFVVDSSTKELKMESSAPNFTHTAGLEVSLQSKN